MANLHFAKLENDVVVSVVIIDPNRESPGQWLQSKHGGEWVRVQQKNAGVGYNYQRPSGKFYPPQPHPSWTLDNQNVWQPPTPRPDTDGQLYHWDESTLTWIK